MEIGLLGPLRVVVAAETVALPAKPAALLAMLAIQANVPLSTDRLIDGLWGESPPLTATKTLQTYVFQLRRILDRDVGDSPVGTIETDGRAYRLAIDPAAIDVERFERSVEAARLAMPGDPLEAAGHADEALRMWRGSPLADFAYEPFAAAEIERLDELRATALELGAEAQLLLGNHETVVADLRRTVAEMPFRERLWEKLMIALYRSGRAAEALAAFRDATRALQDELGAEPGPSLQDLAARIRRGDASLAWAGNRSTVHISLPQRPTSLVGREDELALARELLTQSRLLTITGPGGSGKTRLALELAATAGSTTDDVVFVDLSTVTEREHAISAIAGRLGVGTNEYRRTLAAIGSWLATRRTLIVLDNVEQIDPLGMVVADLLTASGGTRILVTSRVPLRIRGEQQMPLGPLAAPVPGETRLDVLAGSPAVALFVARARAVDPQFELDERNAMAVGELCRRLDGLPLAIELAAVHSGSLDPAAMLERLGSGLDLAGSRDLPERQRTLRHTLEWTLALLTAEEVDLFAGLGVFAGGWTIELMGALGEEIPDPIGALERLIDHSLVGRRKGMAGARFAMLETVRAFARERLLDIDASEAIQDRHAVTLLEGAERQREVALRPGGAGALAWFVDETDNLRAADRRLVATDDVAGGLRLGTAMLTFAQVHLEVVAELRRRIDHFLDRPRAGVPPVVVANALGAAAQLALWQNDDAAAVSLSDESRAIFDRLGDDAAAADQLAASGYAARSIDPGLAAERLIAALDRYRSIGHPAEAYALLGLADVAMRTGDLPLARRWMDELDPELDFPFAPNRAYGFLSRGRLFHLEGDRAAARSAYLSALRIWREAGAVGELPVVVLGLARLALDDGDPVRAMMLAAYAERLAVGDTPGGLIVDPGPDPMGGARALLTPDEAAGAAARGAALSVEELIAVAQGASPD